MKLWLVILATFIVQELVMMNTALLQAFQHGYNLIFVTLLFVCASLFDVFVGYRLGIWVQKTFAHNAFVKKIELKARHFEHLLGDRGYRFVLTLLGFVSLNYVNAFLASWTSLPFRKIATFLMLGDLLWYSAALLMILGVSTLVNPFYAFYAVMGLSALFLVITALLHRRVLKHA